MVMRRTHRVRAVVLASLVLIPSSQVAHGQSPSPTPSIAPGPSASPDLGPSSSPSPGPAALPLPTLPAPADPPVLDPFVPSGPPDARARRSGVVDERVVFRIDPHVARIAIVDRSESCDASAEGSSMVLRFDRPIDATEVAITQRRVVTAP